MKVIRERNINGVFNIAVMNLRVTHSLIEMDSRNGKVYMFPEPVTSVYKRPNERVLFSPERNCNPFFHFIEGLWMLAGRNDLETLTEFVPRMAEFSDDNVLVNGAYGYRWRTWFGRDQLKEVIQMLLANPLDRRVVLQMWDATKDFTSNSKDVPCNTQVFFKCRPITHQDDYVLDMTVTNRSNDMIWGAYGANVVHFSMLHEYVAAFTGYRIGHYYQVSNNAHVYDNVWSKLEPKLPQGYPVDPYEAFHLKTYRLVDDAHFFNDELAEFFNWFHNGSDYKNYRNPLFTEVAMPLVEAWWLHKGGLNVEAISVAKRIQAEDWRKACVEWIERKI